MKKYQTGDLITDTQAFLAERMSEDDLEASVEEAARNAGWMIYHTRDSRKSAAGFPDLTMVRVGVMIYAELKSETGELSDAQYGWLDALAFASHRNAKAFYGGANVIEAPAPWEDGDGYPPMHTRLVQVYVWRPRDWLDGTIGRALA